MYIYIYPYSSTLLYPLYTISSPIVLLYHH